MTKNIKSFDFQQFWDNMKEIVESSDDTIIYLLKAMNFNNPLAYKGIENNQITIDDIISAMEQFVTGLPTGSHHLRYLRISAPAPSSFKLTFGQKMCLRSTLDLIMQKISELSSQQSHGESSTQAAPNRRRGGIQGERITREVDLLRIQEIWDEKLSLALSKHNLIHSNFPIIGSSTQSFPYKFKLKCPKCRTDLQITITQDNGRGSQPHYRFCNFTKHVIACMKK